MVKRGVFQSIAHNIAHHAASGLSYTQPHTGVLSRRLGISPVILDLLAEDPMRGVVEAEEPLGLSSRAVQRKFHEIVAKEQVANDVILSAILEFRFPTDDNYYCVCTCKLIDRDGRLHAVMVPSR